MIEVGSPVFTAHETISHALVRWTDAAGEYHTSRVGVRLDGIYNSDGLTGGTVSMRVLAGPCIQAGDLAGVLNACLPGPWRSVAETLHTSRVTPWRVDVRVGMSGCRTYRLRYLRDQVFHDAPTAATIHVTMHGKVTTFASKEHSKAHKDGLSSIWLGDLAPLLARIAADYAPTDVTIEQVYDSSRYPNRDDENGHWHEPGEPSAIPDVLDRLEAIWHEGKRVAFVTFWRSDLRLARAPLSPQVIDGGENTNLTAIPGWRYEFDGAIPPFATEDEIASGRLQHIRLVPDDETVAVSGVYWLPGDKIAQRDSSLPVGIPVAIGPVMGDISMTACVLHEFSGSNAWRFFANARPGASLTIDYLVRDTNDPGIYRLVQSGPVEVVVP